MRKNAYLVTLALVSPTRNRGSRAQTSIFTVEKQHFWIQMASQASWPPDVPADSLEARSPQPSVLSQDSSARSPQQRFLSKIPRPESSARIPQPGFLSQDASFRSRQPGVDSQESSARIPQPGFLSQDSSVRSPQPGILSKDSSARIPQPGVFSQSVWGPRWSHYYRKLRCTLFFEKNTWLTSI